MKLREFPVPSRERLAKFAALGDLAYREELFKEQLRQSVIAPARQVVEDSIVQELTYRHLSLIHRWLRDGNTVLVWHGNGDGNIQEAPVAACLIEQLKKRYPEESRRIREYPGTPPTVIEIMPGIAI